MAGRRSSSRSASAPGPARSRAGASGASPRPNSTCSRTTSTALTRSSSAVGPLTSRPGWRAAGRARWASTSRARSSRRRAACRRSTASRSRCSKRAASSLPFPDASFDLAISEYGACLWADPYLLGAGGGPGAAPGRPPHLPHQRDDHDLRNRSLGRLGARVRRVRRARLGEPGAELGHLERARGRAARAARRPRGPDAIELGCGTAYVSAWLARRGARPVGIDISSAQLATARRLQQRARPLVPADRGERRAAAVPGRELRLSPISEYGACLWADPYLWVPEAARLLRPGGRLVFLTNGTIMMLCAPDDEDDPLPRDQLRARLLRDAPVRVAGEPSVEFHLGYGDWIRLLRANGFEVEDLIEVRPRAGRDDDVHRRRHARLGPALAVRGGLEGAQARVRRANVTGVRVRVAAERRRDGRALRRPGVSGTLGAVCTILMHKTPTA